MPVPVKVDAELSTYLQDVESRLARIELGQSPLPLFACTTSNMPAASSYVGCVLRNTTLNILAVSDGTNWIRQDSGAVI